jgi:hypothetical protein
LIEYGKSNKSFTKHSISGYFDRDCPQRFNKLGICEQASGNKAGGARTQYASARHKADVTWGESGKSVYIWLELH